MSKKEELIQKWDVFLAKIEERFNDLLAEANENWPLVIEQLEYDSSVISNAWNGISNQVDSLQNKIDDTWDDKMDPLFGMMDEVSGDERMEQLYKGKDLDNKMSGILTQQRIKISADAGRKIYANVIAHIDLNKMHACKQCSAPLAIQIYSFVAKNIKCDACGTVNSYEPDSRIRSLEYYAMNQLAEELVITEIVREEEIGYELWKLDARIPNEKIIVDTLSKEIVSVRKKSINTYYNYLIENITDKATIYENQKIERLKWAEKV